VSLPPFRVPAIIAKKRDGLELSREEIDFLIERYTEGRAPDYQLSAFAMAVFFRGMSERETTDLTRAMLHSGQILDLSDIEGPKADKHSTGGVGDKTSLILAPIVAACGVSVPMISGRGLAHSGGTLDKLESIPGMRVMLPLSEFRRLLRAHRLSFIGQTEEIAPADRKLYALRDVTATVPVPQLIAASIMGKKLAEGIDALVLDVKTGDGAFMREESAAIALAERMVGIGRGMGKKVMALITDMDQPNGLCVGNSLEIRESIDTLKGRGPKDLTDLSIELAAWMLRLCEIEPSLDAARRRCAATIASGAALALLQKVIDAQGGDPRVCDDTHLLPEADERHEIRASESGWVRRLGCLAIGEASMLLGAGRNTVADVIDPSVGIVIERRVGDHVTRGDLLATLHYNRSERRDAALARLEGAFDIHPERPPVPETIRRLIGG
jgi:pyrimidine-nucleoside phosphorylase/thymidine phosphorylase